MAVYQPNTDPKRNLNTGIPGQVGTADTVNEGGIKIADNFNQIYDTFADLRLTSSGTQIGKQVLHASGVYQLIDQDSNLRPGGLYTVDATDLEEPLTVYLPPIKEFSTSSYDGSYAVSGTKIVLQDATSSWGDAGIIIESALGDTITGAVVDGDSQKLYVLESDQEICLVAFYDTDSGNARWKVASRNINTFDTQPSEINSHFSDNFETEVFLLDMRSFKTIKYLVYAEELNPSGDIVRTSSSEILLLGMPINKVSTTPQELSSTQYATVMWDEQDDDYSDLFEYDFMAYVDIITNKPRAVMNVTSEVTPPNTLNISINTIDII